MNRELKQRVRPINGLSLHKQVIKQDIKHAAKIVQNYDNKWNLWDDNDEKKDAEKEVCISPGFLWGWEFGRKLGISFWGFQAWKCWRICFGGWEFCVEVAKI